MMSRVLDSRIIECSAARTLTYSLLLHSALMLLLIGTPYLRFRSQTLRIGGGPGGGRPGESIYAVGLADDLGGGSGLHRPSPIPQPPVLKVDPPDPKKTLPEVPKLARTQESKGVPIPEFSATKKSRSRESDRFKASKPAPALPGNVIPVPSGAGAGGTGAAGGSGGGTGGGQGVSLGSGTGGFGESWYARAVERRISENWLRSLMGPDLTGKYQAIVAFFIQGDGTIRDINIQKSSGNATVDMSATRAVMAANPLPPVPPEFRGQRLRILAYFEYPPTP